MTELPYNDYYEYFAPDYRLHLQPNNMENLNTREYLERHLQRLMEYLRHVNAPNVTGQEVPTTVVIVMAVVRMLIVWCVCLCVSVGWIAPAGYRFWLGQRGRR